MVLALGWVVHGFSLGGHEFDRRNRVPHLQRGGPPNRSSHWRTSRQWHPSMLATRHSSLDTALAEVQQFGDLAYDDVYIERFADKLVYSG